jgi:hypothetical protein
MADVEVFKESPVRFSEFLTSFTVEAAEADEDNLRDLTIPADVAQLLCSLRVELLRARAGMSDFIIRVATPTSKANDKPTVVSIRGNRGMSKLEGIKKLVQVVRREMLARGDECFKWEKLDEEAVVDMLISPIKFFSTNTSSDLLRFTTEALSEEQENG